MSPFAKFGFLTISALAIGLAIPVSSPATLIVQEFNYSLTTTDDPSGRGRSFSLVDGSVGPLGVMPGPLEMLLVPSNQGSNLQVTFQQNSGGAVVITEIGSPAMSWLAQNFGPGEVIGPNIPDAPVLPGYSPDDRGTGRVRFFGNGNFESGVPGILGFRVAAANGDLHYGYAEITGTDNVGFVLHRTVYESTPFTPISVPVPEPSSAVLVAVGAVLLRWWKRC